MIIKSDISLIYLCPVCLSPSAKGINIFNFSRYKTLKLKCQKDSCHEKCVSLTHHKDKIKVDIECPYCGDLHSYSANLSSFIKRPVIEYKCSAINKTIFVLGDKEKISPRINVLAKELKDITSEFVYEPIYNAKDADLIVEMLDTLEALHDEHKIACTCKSDNFSLELIDNKIAIICNTCNSIRTLDINEDVLKMLLNTDSVLIGD